MSAVRVDGPNHAQAGQRGWDVVTRALGEAAKRPEVTSFFDESTNTVSHIVRDPASRRCGVIDSVLDYDAASGRTTTKSADTLIAFIREQGLEVEWILETHVHADHLSAAPYIKDRLGGALSIGENVNVVQDIFGKVFNAGTEFQRDGSQFDHLFTNGERFTIGELDAIAMHTPGHTPDSVTYVIGDAAFVGDTLFMPDYARREPTFPVAMRVRSTSPPDASYRFPERRGCFSATTTRRPGGTNSSGKPRSKPRVRTMCMSMTG